VPRSTTSSSDGAISPLSSLEPRVLLQGKSTYAGRPNSRKVDEKSRPGSPEVLATGRSDETIRSEVAGRGCPGPQDNLPRLSTAI
jgi:hypothetical protein